MTIRVFAPATIGNVGPGFDCLGLCLEGLGDIISAEPADTLSIGRIEGRSADLIPTDPEKNTATIAAKAFLEAIGSSTGIKLSIERHLPVSGGLGSSAASAVGGAMAAAVLNGCKASDPRIIEAALTAESSSSGKHLDNIAPCFYGGLTIVQNIEPIHIIQAPVAGSWWIAVVSPAIELDTKKSRKALPTELPTEAWVKQNANTAGMLAGLATDDGEIFVKSFEDLFAEPARSPLIPPYQDVKSAALKAGALGCTISGGGPSIFAVAKSQEAAQSIGQAMQDVAGAGATLHVSAFAKEGARII